MFILLSRLLFIYGVLLAGIWIDHPLFFALRYKGVISCLLIDYHFVFISFTALLLSTNACFSAMSFAFEVFACERLVAEMLSLK
jgi:hypothetical protein